MRLTCKVKREMKDTQEFEEEWKEVLQKGDKDFIVSMLDSWIKEHRQEFNYLICHYFRDYKIISQEEVKLFANDSGTIIVPINGIYAIM